jgi:hypothetical protein
LISIAYCSIGKVWDHPTYHRSAKSVILPNAAVLKSCILRPFDTKSDEEVLQNIADLNIKEKGDVSSCSG